VDGAGTASAGSGERLVGRAREVAVLTAFLDHAAHDGGVLVIRGEPGMGKTALLEAAASMAAGRGALVLRATGVQFEADVGYAGLSQLLGGLLTGIERLPEPHREALLVALGFGEGPAAGRALVLAAVTELLRPLAAEAPILIVVDDLPWLDRPSAAVLNLVTRSGLPRIGFLAASREGDDGFFDSSGLATLDVPPLDEAAAAVLVDSLFPDLAPRVRLRLLAEAAGNPLGLRELPAGLTDMQRSAQWFLPPFLPLSRRLKALYEQRIGDLPPRERTLLLMAALEGTGDLAAVLAAGAATADDLAEAEREGFVTVEWDVGRVTFGHPLVRAAAVEMARGHERRAAHRALAAVSAARPDQQAWHLAEATLEPDERVAGLLDAVARRALLRGDAAGAVTVLAKAADLSPADADRARRIAEAAYVGSDISGDLRIAERLLDRAQQEQAQLAPPLQAAMAASYLLLNSDGDVDTAHRLLVGALDTVDVPLLGASAAIAPNGIRTCSEALFTLLEICLYGGRAELWPPFDRHARRLASVAGPLLRLWIDTLVDLPRTTHRALDELDAQLRGLGGEDDPARVERVAIVALFLDRAGDCRDALERLVHDNQVDGAVAPAIGALMVLCIDDAMTGAWQAARVHAEEGIALCTAHGYRLLEWPFRYGLALRGAACGDGTTIPLADTMIRWAAPRRMDTVQHYAMHVQAVDALARGDFESAYEHVTMIQAAGRIGPHRPLAVWSALDLVEAAARSGRHTEAAAHADAMREAGLGALSPRLDLHTKAASAIARPERRAAAAFADALATPGTERWPFDRARVRLGHGELLARTGIADEAEAVLAGAFHAFRRMGAAPWAIRAAGWLHSLARLPPAPENSAFAALDAADVPVAVLAALDLPAEEIASRVGTAEQEAEARIRNIRCTLGARTGEEIAAVLAPGAPEPPWPVARPNHHGAPSRKE
jgi:hypothetical protein